MQILVQPGGSVRSVYKETIPLGQLGKLSIQRGSHVEPDNEGQWYADLSPVSGPRLGPFTHRSSALEAEVAWLERYWLAAGQ